MDYFNLKFHKTTVKNEIFAGIAMFMAMSYILVVCPTVLSGAGMDYNGVFLATVCVTGFTTIVSAFYTKLPIALAPGLGMTSMFLTLATGPRQIPWQTLLLATYVAGIIICAFVRFGTYNRIMEIMDVSFRRMLMSGIGLALFMYGISTLGLIEKKNGWYVPGSIQPVPLIICIFSLAVIYFMKRWNKRGYVLAGLVTAYVLSLSFNYYEAYQLNEVSVREYFRDIFTMSFQYKDISNVMLEFPDITAVFGEKKSFLAFIYAVFVFTMGHFFDAIGTNTSSFDAITDSIDLRIKDTVSLKRAITVDGIGNVVSGLMGTPTVTTYGESMVGIVSGGKTGITALTAGCLFLLCFFFSPLFTSMATYVAAPALIYVGTKLILRFREFDRKRIAIFLFGACLILYVGVTFNIGNAVLYGLALYTLINRIVEKKKPVSHWWIMLIFAAVHVLLNYVV